MSFIKRLISDFRISDPLYPLCTGTAFSILGIVTLISSSCHPMYQWLLLPRSALPYWIFATVGIIMFFLNGAAIGFLFSFPHCQNKVFTTLITLSIAAVLAMIWYHVLFHSISSFMAIPILICAMACEVFAALSISSYNTLTCASLIPLILIQVHFLWLNIGILFLN